MDAAALQTICHLLPALLVKAASRLPFGYITRARQALLCIGQPEEPNAGLPIGAQEGLLCNIAL